MRSNDPTEVASWLAMALAGVDACTSHSCTDKQRQEARVKYHVGDFLDAFRAALTYVVPTLIQYKRPGSIKHAGGVGDSYRDLTCLLALDRYRNMWLMVDAESYLAWCERRKSTEYEELTGEEINVTQVIAGWDDVADFMGNRDAINGRFLSKGIGGETESSPPTEWSRPMSKKEAASILGCRASKKAEWFSDCVKKGLYVIRDNSRSAIQVDITAFPPEQKEQFRCRS